MISAYDFFYFKIGKSNLMKVLRLAFVLRLLINFKKMAELTTYIFYTIGPLSQVGTAFLLIVLIYSVIGIKLFGDAVGRRCRLTPQPDDELKWEIDPNQYNMFCGFQTCTSGTYCGSYVREGYKDSQIDLELETKKMNYGLSIYNNIVNALTTNLIIVAGDDWSHILYMVI